MSIVFKSPDFDNLFTRFYLNSISKRFTDKISSQKLNIRFLWLRWFAFSWLRNSLERNISRGTLNILIRGINVLRCLAWISDLDESMFMDSSCFTLFTKIIILASCASVSDSSNWISVASITNEPSVDDCRLSRDFFFLIFFKHQLETVFAIRSNFFSYHSNYFYIEGIRKISQTITFFTLVTFFVDLRSVTPETRKSRITVSSFPFLCSVNLA